MRPSRRAWANYCAMPLRKIVAAREVDNRERGRRLGAVPNQYRVSVDGRLDLPVRQHGPACGGRASRGQSPALTPGQRRRAAVPP
jgi:hypothetical protein